jgi:hypothetical protein
LFLFEGPLYLGFLSAIMLLSFRDLGLTGSYRLGEQVESREERMFLPLLLKGRQYSA